jgi:hypothetical protein
MTKKLTNKKNKSVKKQVSSKFKKKNIKKNVSLKKQTGGNDPKIGDLFEYTDMNGINKARIIDITKTQYIFNKYIFGTSSLKKLFRNTVLDKKYDPSIWKLISLNTKELEIYELGKKILTQNILNQEIIDEIIKNPTLNQHLIDEYYTAFDIKKDDTNKGPRYDRRLSYIDPITLAKVIYTKIMSDVNDSKSSDNIYFILAPGDSASKIVAVMLLIPEYLAEFNKRNINMITFPLSDASKWDETSSKEYLTDVLKPYLKSHDKSKIYFGILDAISRGGTITMLNKTLTDIGYTNIIEKLRFDTYDPETIDESWHPRFGYNLIGTGSVFERAEKDPEVIPNRCMPTYEIANYTSKTIDEKDYREQLYNCNIYLYYWYIMKYIESNANSTPKSLLLK